MRVIAEIPHPVYKITLFAYGERYTLKLEDGLYEQSFKFRKTDLPEGHEAIREMLDEAFFSSVKESFKIMREASLQMWHKKYPVQDMAEEEII